MKGSRDLLSLGNHFVNPPNEYRAYAIVHSPSSQRYQMNAKKGYGGVVSNVEWNENYLCDESSFKQLKQGQEYLNKEKLGLWIYDESWYPSGRAGGLVTKINDMFCTQLIVEQKTSGKGRSRVKIETHCEKAEPICSYLFKKRNGMVDYSREKSLRIEDNAVVCDGIEGEYEVYTYYKVYLKDIAKLTNPPHKEIDVSSYIDYLNPKAVEKYLCLTHQKYNQHINLSEVGAFFTDEPALIGVCVEEFDLQDCRYAVYSPMLFDAFYEMHGYDLAPKLAKLFTGSTVAEKTVRIHYYQTIAKLFSENYFGQISKWCEQHHTNLSGHLIWEEDLSLQVGFYGNFMLCQRAMSFQGFDILQAVPNPSSGEYIGAKFASSTARMKGNNLVMAEYCPWEGDLKKYKSDTLKQIQGIANLIFFSGATHINSYHEGTVECDSQWNKQIGRLALVMRNAISDAKVAVYYPIETIQTLVMPGNSARLHENPVQKEADEIDDKFKNFGKKLFKEKIDYNFIDDLGVINSVVSNDGMKIEGNTYQVIVMPFMDVIPFSVMQKIGLFERLGGKVFWIEKTPHMGITDAEHVIVQELIQKQENKVYMLDDEILYKEIKSCDSHEISILEDQTKDIYISYHTTIDDKKIVFILNTSEEGRKLTVVSKANFIEKYDPITGEISTVENDELILSGLSSVFLVC